jgi:hypothetical protein
VYRDSREQRRREHREPLEQPEHREHPHQKKNINSRISGYILAERIYPESYERSEVYQINYRAQRFKSDQQINHREHRETSHRGHRA